MVFMTQVARDHAAQTTQLKREHDAFWWKVRLNWLIDDYRLVRPSVLCRSRKIVIQIWITVSLKVLLN